jgi:aminoglycoside phosphotransferase (APT) family kinase protein
MRYDPLDAPGRGTLYGKLYSTSEDGERIFRLAKQIAEWLALHEEGVTSVRPLAHVAGDAVILYPQIPGTPLSEHLRRTTHSLASSLKNTGAALYALHQLPQAVAGPLEVHDFVAEVEQIARTSEHVCTLLPSVGATLKALLDQARELYERMPPEPPTFAHGDFKAEHVWVAPGGLTLMDFDKCHVGDPALDLGKFLADLRFWCSVYGQHELRQAQEQFLAGYGSGASVERVVRARLYEAIELVKQTVRRVRTLGHGWARRTERLISCAQAALDDLQVTLGLPAKR